MALLSAITPSAAPVVEPTGTWSGKVKDEALSKLAPASGFIATAETWKGLWIAWRPGEDLPRAIARHLAHYLATARDRLHNIGTLSVLSCACCRYSLSQPIVEAFECIYEIVCDSPEDLPEVDFAKELVLVGTVSGPNLVMTRPTIDEKGDVKFIVGGTKMAGPGFGYKLISISRKDVKTVNGKASTGEIARLEDSITVTIVGTLRTGIFAIGGETTGTTISAKGITWDLQLGESLAYQQAAERLHGKQVIVRGNLERRRGVEIKERWIVTVTELQAVDAADLGGGLRSRLIATVGRADTRIRFVSEPKTTIVDIVSGFGIDTATIKRESNSWPASIVVRLHLKGLESFKAMAGETAVEWSVSSTGPHAKRVSLRKGGDESALDETSQRSTRRVPIIPKSASRAAAAKSRSKMAISRFLCLPNCWSATRKRSDCAGSTSIGIKRVV